MSLRRTQFSHGDERLHFSLVVVSSSFARAGRGEATFETDMARRIVGLGFVCGLCGRHCSTCVVRAGSGCLRAAVWASCLRAGSGDLCGAGGVRGSLAGFRTGGRAMAPMVSVADDDGHGRDRELVRCSLLYGMELCIGHGAKYEYLYEPLHSTPSNNSIAMRSER